ncbi:hypothetical protein J2Z83_003889 [Virgibacillus natechei]|uniref:Uncharacterized protein n=1 Tax=Virgibacillus natechei TaxID=1216297 RepID=A0ABS4IL97_9BACI|nr:hypothetical protein [Virgibacillus natechei]MBP1971734.1 hypothetical protein [Virgibacillus natechei]UZD12340.1 hypothetical protein OLD84_15685 [Virgibacillus natechei]
MDKRTLVENDFRNGENLILALDNENFAVHSALWLFDTERDSWRLIIASEKVDHSGPKKAYEGIYKVINILKKEEENFTITLDNISVVSPFHELIKDIGTTIQTGVESIAGIRCSRNTINNHYIEDAYIYRMQ